MPNQRKVGIILGYTNILTKNIVNLVYTPMLLFFVGQADYGVYQSCNSFVFSLTLLSFGFSQAYVRFYMLKKAKGVEEEISRLNTVYLVLYSVVSIVALVLGLAFAANAGAVFADGFTDTQIATASTVMSILAYSIAITLFNSIFDAYVLAQERFFFQQSRQLAVTLAMPFVAFALLCLGMGVIGVAIAQLVVNIALLGLNTFFCLKRLRMRFDFHRFDMALFKSISVFSSWLFINQICELINQNVPNILLGAFSGAVAVAVFAVSIQIRSLFYSLSTTMSNVFIPLINRIVAESNDNTRLSHLMTKVGRYQAILYIWILGGFAILGKFFIDVWAGPGFKDVYWLVLAMAVPLFIPLVQNTGIEIQRAKNKHKARSVCYLFMAGLNLAITILLSPYISYWAAAIGYISYVILGCGVFMNWYYQKRIGLSMGYFWKRVLPVIGVGVVATGICLYGTSLLPVNDWVSFFLWGIVYTLLYAVLAFMTILAKEERRSLIQRIRRVTR